MSKGNTSVTRFLQIRPEYQPKEFLYQISEDGKLASLSIEWPGSLLPKDADVTIRAAGAWFTDGLIGDVIGIQAGLIGRTKRIETMQLQMRVDPDRGVIPLQQFVKAMRSQGWQVFRTHVR